jgi:hypothetical protein
MSAYPLSDLGHKGLPDPRTEILIVDVHYPEWMIDSQRLGIEWALERCFSTWLEFILIQENVSTYVGDRDSISFQEGYDIIYASIEHMILPEQYMPFVYPGFVISEVSSGGIKSKKHIALLLSAAVSGGISGLSGYIFGSTGPVFSQPVSTPKLATVSGALVCTAQTAQGFVQAMNSIKKEEPLVRGDTNAVLQEETNDMLRQIAMMPNSKCNVTVTVTVDDNEVGRYEMTRDEAKSAYVSKVKHCRHRKD